MRDRLVINSNLNLENLYVYIDQEKKLLDMGGGTLAAVGGCGGFIGLVFGGVMALDSSCFTAAACTGVGAEPAASSP
jgi:hypothetical protein